MQQRKRLRLDGYDYATTGAYFATVVARRRAASSAMWWRTPSSSCPRRHRPACRGGHRVVPLWGGTRRLRGHAQSRPCARVSRTLAPATFHSSGRRRVQGAGEPPSRSVALATRLPRPNRPRRTRARSIPRVHRDESAPVGARSGEPRASADSTGRMRSGPYAFLAPAHSVTASIAHAGEGDRVRRRCHGLDHGSADAREGCRDRRRRRTQPGQGRARPRRDRRAGQPRRA